jgi:hypothetical protein
MLVITASNVKQKTLIKIIFKIGNKINWFYSDGLTSNRNMPTISMTTPKNPNSQLKAPSVSVLVAVK